MKHQRSAALLALLLLSEAGLPAVSANRFAKHFPVVWPLHVLLPEQERQPSSTQYAVYFTKASRKFPLARLPAPCTISTAKRDAPEAAA
jgi:predicted nucleic acid binding AN1-type Zn finger protein